MYWEQLLPDAPFVRKTSISSLSITALCYVILHMEDPLVHDERGLGRVVGDVRRS